MTTRQALVALATIFVLILAGCSSSGKTGTPLSSRTMAALGILDNELGRRDTYSKIRRNRIDSLKNIMSSHGQTAQGRLEQTWKLATLYEGFMSDSAIHWYTTGEQLAHASGNPYWRTRFKVNKIKLMPLTTIMHQAVDEFNGIAISDTMSNNLKSEIYESGRQLYKYMASYYDQDPVECGRWSDLAIAMIEKVIEVTPHTSHTYMIDRGEYLYITGQYDRSVLVIDSLLSIIPHDTNLAARAFYLMSNNAEAMNRHDEQVYWLALSAIADIRSATLEVKAITTLGGILYEYGDINRAHKYLTASLSNAVECHAALRMIETSRVLPIINVAQQNAQTTYRRNYTWGIVIMAAIITSILIVLSRLRFELKRTRILKMRLERANQAKETYLSQFMSLATNYMNKLDEFCHITERKIANGKVDELYNLARSRRFVEDQTHDFYATFDNAFINLYPSFVEDVNALLLPDQQIEYTPGEPFNTDLRILAFMRIGVDDTAMMAKALNYSINTIYAYRNRLKKKAINRETFEQQIMNIGRGAETYNKPY